MTRFNTLAGLVIAAILIYAGLWYTTAFKTEKKVIDQFSAWRDKGLKVDHGNVSSEGFPYRLVIKVQKPVLHTREDGLYLAAKEITLTSHLWTPGHWVAEATDTEFSLAGDTIKGKDGYTRASYKLHGDDLPVIVVDSGETDDFVLEKAPGLTAPTSLKKWQLFLRPGVDTAAAESALYDKPFLQFKIVMQSDIASMNAEGEISGPVIKDWSKKELSNWSADGGLLMLKTLQLETAGAKLSGDASLTLDEEFRPLGSATVSIEGGDKLTAYLASLGLNTHESLRAYSNVPSGPLPLMLQSGQVMLDVTEIMPLKPVIN